MRYVGSGDTEPAELLPVSILREGDLDFDEFVADGDLPYPYRRVNGRVVSAYPIVAGLLNVPVYAVGHVLGADPMARRHTLSLITASLLCAGASLFMYLALLRVFRGSRGRALAFALVFAFATAAWSVASRGMWPHAPSLFFLSAAMALLSSGGKGMAWSGLSLGLAVVNRPTNLLLALPLAIFVWRHGRQWFLAFVGLAVLPAIAVALYSAGYLGDALAFGQDYRPGGFGGNVLSGLAGLLVSPSRGLLVFSPFFLFSAAGAVMAWRENDPLPRYLVAGTVLSLLLYARWGMWWGGASFGYRLLIELVPGLILLAAIAWRDLVAPRRALRVVFGALVLVSVFFHFLGAHVYPSRFNENLDFELGRLWDWRESEPVLLTRKLFSPGTADASPSDVPAFWWTAEKNDDAIPGWLDASPGGRVLRGAMDISGWAKSEMGEVDVRILLRDGRVVAPERYSRPDVAHAIPALGDTSRAGFRTVLEPPRSRPSEEVLVVELRSPAGKVRRLGPVRFRWE